TEPRKNVSQEPTPRKMAPASAKPAGTGSASGSTQAPSAVVTTSPSSEPRAEGGERRPAGDEPRLNRGVPDGGEDDGRERLGGGAAAAGQRLRRGDRCQDRERAAGVVDRGSARPTALSWLARLSPHRRSPLRLASTTLHTASSPRWAPTPLQATQPPHHGRSGRAAAYPNRRSRSPGGQDRGRRGRRGRQPPAAGAGRGGDGAPS